MKEVDVLFIGATSYDLSYQINNHPGKDEKINAYSFVECGGGPAANAAFTAARLGVSSAFMGYLGNDHYGQMHLKELIEAGVDVSQIARGKFTTPLSVILIKPDGQRSLINYRNQEGIIQPDECNLEFYKPKVILLDGHEPDISIKILQGNPDAISILDAGSVHNGTRLLIGKVDYLICSEKFALDYTKKEKPSASLGRLYNQCRNIVVTLGDKGLIFKNENSQGCLPAYSINVLDTTGAGDIFHGTFAYSLVKNFDFFNSLLFSSAAAAYCCTKIGGRIGAPNIDDIKQLMNKQKLNVKPINN